ncbi:hypothetical protein ElyMa_006479700 [Elysia marginata]|uniref:Uncharacterized protein n=1 Tax=Elysia marginata TaxID=1093978 RepID=A0AAV4I171_9GAST|nr:hypothetical protein ElyMa_006479700 [Elysia marginata]
MTGQLPSEGKAYQNIQGQIMAWIKGIIRRTIQARMANPIETRLHKHFAFVETVEGAMLTELTARTRLTQSGIDGDMKGIRSGECAL